MKAQSRHERQKLITMLSDLAADAARRTAGKTKLRMMQDTVRRVYLSKPFQFLATMLIVMVRTIALQSQSSSFLFNSSVSSCIICSLILSFSHSASRLLPAFFVGIQWRLNSRVAAPSGAYVAAPRPLRSSLSTFLTLTFSCLHFSHACWLGVSHFNILALLYRILQRTSWSRSTPHPFKGPTGLAPCSTRQ